MKIKILLLLSLVVFSKSHSQGDSSIVRRIAISAHPSGLIQFGPIINLDLYLGNQWNLNAHIRFPGWGVLNYYLIDDLYYSPDKISGTSVGLGTNYFFAAKKNSPFLGFFADYQKTKARFSINEISNTTITQLKWLKSYNTFIIAITGGYHFTPKDGLFLTGGGSLGIAFSEWSRRNKGESDYLFQGEPSEGEGFILPVIFNFSIGVELWTLK